jgi:uncharacterized protein YifN (PemK superfamily)
MMIDCKLLLSAAALCAVFSLNAEAKLYKWVDDNGTTHYGETIPPEYANKDAVKLEKGRIEKRDDKHGKEAQKADQEEQATIKSRLEAKRRDDALLNTYSNEKEIDLARERNLQQVDARTGSYTTLLKSAQDNLGGLKQEFDKLTQQARKIPKSLDEDIQEATLRVAKLQNDLDTNRKEIESVKARYAADKARYRELKGLTPQEVPQSKPQEKY